MDVRITLLGGYSVTVDGTTVPPEAWARRHAASLVKLLALADGRRLHRDQVVEALWPGLGADAALPRLHKAAHYARRALGGAATALLLRNDVVALLPDDAVTVDAQELRRRGQRALADRSVDQAAAVLDAVGGVLLPDDVYEAWTEEPRESLRVLRTDLQRLAGRWEALLDEHPSDEEAHLALVRRHAERGDLRAAVRQFERLDQALRHELGTAPSPAAEALRAALLRDPRLRGTAASVTADDPAASAAPASGPPGQGADHRLVGRRNVGDRVRAAMDRAAGGRGSTLLVTGPPGVGKSAVLDLAVSLARRRRWRTGRGSASAVEGPWPYAPVLEALGDLCRNHPTLLDGLGDSYREEIERALAGKEVTWSGETAHQRLFVAAAELLRLAAAGEGVLLIVDDVHEADEASLRLLHYLARCAVAEPAVIALAHRFTDGPTLDGVQASLLARGAGTRIDLQPLDERATLRLLAHEFPELDEQTAGRIWALSGGLPFTVLEMGRAARSGASGPVGGGLPEPVRRTFQKVALLGLSFTTDELLAVAGLPEDEAYHRLEAAVAALVVEPAESGYRFRHPLVREELLRSLPPHRQAALRREVAEHLAELGASPSRVAHQFLAAGQPSRAIPYVLPAVETAGALGAYRDALTLVDAVLDHTSGEVLGHLLARRGDLLTALGDPEAVAAYREAVPLTTGTEQRLVRARLARAACFGGDFETAAAALEGLEIEGDTADGPILLARGNLAYFTGDMDAALDAAGRARTLLLTRVDPWHYVDLLSLQGLIAHQRGQWFERFRRELRRTPASSGLATVLFDAHLCVAEYLLYGPVPYAEVIDLAEGLRRRAGQVGALRGTAFATALIGEAALLMGDLDRAEHELTEAAALHRDVDAPAGEAHALQRLAEVRLARGDRAGAESLLQRALPAARWSAVGMHLLQRIYGTMIRAAEDSEAARIVVDRAEATLGESDRCVFCDIMLAVPAAIACADSGDVDGARGYLEVAETTVARWEGTAWQAGVLEARAHLAVATGAVEEARRCTIQAERLFTQAGQPLDAERCARFGEDLPAAALQGA
ncbi:MAG TPA: AAA family ATPase [Nocardioidaceae bacterium]|jgi:DNA-binding SARP family transcriptional activator